MALRLMERMYISTDVKPGPSEASKTLVIVVRKACNFPDWNSCPIYFPLQSILHPVHRLVSLPYGGTFIGSLLLIKLAVTLCNLALSTTALCALICSWLWVCNACVCVCARVRTHTHAVKVYLGRGSGFSDHLAKAEGPP